jgi:hypothetical protein
MGKFPVLIISPNVNYITCAELNTNVKRPENSVHKIKREDKKIICNSTYS